MFSSYFTPRYFTPRYFPGPSGTGPVWPPLIAWWFYITWRAMFSYQAPTGLPPVAPTDGIDLISLHAFTVTVECDAGQTFTTGGCLDLYIYDENVGAWSIVPKLQEDIPARVQGLRRFTFLAAIINSRGREAYVTNGVGVTGGGIKVYYSPTLAQHPPLLA